MRPIILTAAILLSACTQTTGNYVRLDGKAVDGRQAQAMLLQCQGYAAQSVHDHVYAGGIAFPIAMVSRAEKANAITNGCMARAGYVVQ